MQVQAPPLQSTAHVCIPRLRQSTVCCCLTLAVSPTLLDYVGDLVSSMIAANQEVSQPLLDLASKDPRFKKGQKRSAGRGAGRGGGRGRRGGSQVGGAGLGFGNTGYAPGTSLAAASATKGEAGFAPSGLGASFSAGGFESTVEGTNASVASKYQPQPDPPMPESLPPPPSLVPTYPSEAEPQPADAAEAQPAAVPYAVPGPSSAPAARAAVSARQQHPQPFKTLQQAKEAAAAAAQQPFKTLQQAKDAAVAAQQPQQPFKTLQQAKEAAAAEAAAAAAAQAKQQAPPAQVQGTFSGFRGMYTNRFGTSFVSSGSTGGDQSMKATIVAPKQQAQRSAVPAPIPVTERPLFNRPGGLGAAAYQASTHQVHVAQPGQQQPCSVS